ncbi:hypothetical protein KIN20_030570 [Parelaphostrongylus tenuis]|uniref:Uncharacterized protein n=1 Tax=Parelaphostrongylus tenuis TaxID=148309 RepID=A0AAD5R4B5_PARTN|nr:hypothetical protein KIN20_030570 [Parelaphostrongylus tenuis]
MAQQTTRFEICFELPERYRRGNLDLQHIVTCDEKWVSFENPHRHNEWRLPGRGSFMLPDLWLNVIDSGDYFDY